MNKQKYLSILDEIKEQGGSDNGDNPNDNVLIIDGLNTFNESPFTNSLFILLSYKFN